MSITSKNITSIVKKIEQGPRGYPGVPGGSATMDYPDAGIALSTGVAWTVGSITNNSANWNTAYSWGNWASNFGSIAGKICQGNDARLSDSRVASDVYAWAKAAVKPAYTKSEVGLSNVDNTADANKSVNYATSAGSVTGGITGTQSGSYTNYLTKYSGNATIAWSRILDDGTNPVTIAGTAIVLTNDARLSDSRPASDVYAWAKASTKPSYTKSEVGLSNVDNTADANKTVSALTGHSAGYAYADGGTSSGVTISYNDNTNASFQMLWGSSNGVFGTAGITCNPYTDVISAVNFNATSDRTLKKDIKSIKAKEVKAQYKQFRMKSNPDQLRYGIIAQDLQKTHPELVYEENGILSVAYFDLLCLEVAQLKDKLNGFTK